MSRVGSRRISSKPVIPLKSPASAPAFFKVLQCEFVAHPGGGPSPVGRRIPAVLAEFRQRGVNASRVEMSDPISCIGVLKADAEVERRANGHLIAL